MARTKRYIPHYCRGVQPYEKAWIGLGNYHVERDPRNRLENGYDHHFGVSGIWEYGSHTKRGWKDPYCGNSRRFYKRAKHQAFRHLAKQIIKEELAMLYANTNEDVANE